MKDRFVQRLDVKQLSKISNINIISVSIQARLITLSKLILSLTNKELQLIKISHPNFEAK